ncbi:prepilin-type N-terminal cleavage/methylation domain-containing protein [Mitsuaria sp. CC2]|jgi:general secretion pathway protein J|uniref:PulJ/GspJ family protein n=1 Tax=Mitsuaria sp. CC2 TaxID=3029186 RepID=UPI003B8BC01D
MRRSAGPSRRAARGFTLIEVVVALVVMAIMSVMAWRAVSALTTSRERNEAAMDRAETLQTLIRQWELDLREVQKSDVFDALTFDGATLRVTRRRETGLQLVAWQLKEGRLARWESQTLNSADALRDAWFRSQQLSAKEMRELPGLDRVTGWQMYFFQRGAWANAQSTLDKDTDQANKDAAATSAVPEGVRMRLQFGEDSGYRGELIREVAVEGGS